MKREETLKRLGETWAKYPSLRLCQLIEAAVIKNRCPKWKGETDNHPCIFYIENDELIRILESFKVI